MNAVVLLLGVYLHAGQTDVTGNQPATLPEVVKTLNADTKTPGDELIKTGMKFIKEAIPLRWADEHAFIIAVANRDSNAPQYRKNLEGVLETVILKYKDEEPHALLRVLILAADLYRNSFGDRKKERELLAQAEQLQEKLVTQQALSQLDVFIKLGESHLGVIDPASGTEKKSLEYYRKVIEFEFPGSAFNPRYGEYQTLYTAAAMRLVAMTKNTELKNLRFLPFAGERLARHYPEKFKLIGKGSPDIAAFNAKVERWLEFTSEDLPKNNPMRPHFKGVLEYLRKDRPD